KIFHLFSETLAKFFLCKGTNGKLPRPGGLKMKRQTELNVKAHLVRGAFYLLLLVTVVVIPLALGQRASKENTVATLPGGDNPSSASWNATGNLNTGRYEHTMTLLANGKVLVAGGFDGFSSTITAELYDSSSGTWTPTADLVTQRREHTA